jgi:hypothetical protein
MEKLGGGERKNGSKAQGLRSLARFARLNTFEEREVGLGFGIALNP